MSAIVFLSVLAVWAGDPTSPPDIVRQDGAAPRPGVVTPARWINPPSPEAAAALIPGFANNIGVSGRVSLRCWAREQGLPQDCEVTAAAPTGMGFEAAALQVARTGVVQPATLDGVPVLGQLVFNVNFESETIEEAPWDPTPYEGPEPTPTAMALARQIVLQALEGSKASEEEALLDGLADDRREIVRAWLRELRPDNDEQFVANQTLMLARLAVESEMAAFLADGTLPTTPPPGPEDIARATSDMGDPADDAAWIALRDRYCARWSCAPLQPN